MTKLAEESFKEIGFSPTYAYLLMTIHEMPNISSKELAQELFIAQSTLTRLVDKMVYQGYIERKQEGRKIFVSLTKKGLDVQASLSRQWFKLHDRYNALIGKESSKALVQEMNLTSEKLESREVSHHE